MIHLKRIYEPADPLDGHRVLIDRLWPRGFTKSAAQLDEWLKEIAPSTELRRWFSHQAEHWDEFVARYRAELAGADAVAQLERLRCIAGAGPLTLLYAARDELQNHAIVLRDLLQGR